MSKLHIGIVISTVRPNRFGDTPAGWISDLANKRADLSLEVVDLIDYPLPFFAELEAPVVAPPTPEVARRWSAKMAQFDGYIFVFAEYIHGIPGVLKNALDYLAHETRRKPAAIVGYGVLGAARGVEQLRLVLLELGAAPLGKAVHIALPELRGVVGQGKALSDFPYLVRNAEQMLDELSWWTRVLKAGREPAARPLQDQAAGTAEGGL